MRSRTWIDSHPQTARRTATESVMGMFLRAVAESFRRARQRRELAALSDHSLRDIGLNRVDVQSEASKLVWRL